VIWRVGALSPFLLYPAPGLLERHRHRTANSSAHAALITEILGLLAGNESAPRRAGPRRCTIR
jgi:LuxR family maltose regulon positive regulatory protein